jgi:hypothetical protein
MVSSPKVLQVSRAYLVHPPKRARPKMTRGLPKLVLASGMAGLACTCMRLSPARPGELPDLPDYEPSSHVVQSPPPGGVVGAAPSFKVLAESA